MAPVEINGPFNRITVAMVTEASGVLDIGTATVNTVVPGLLGFGVEDGLTVNSTFAQDSVIVMGSGVDEVDREALAAFGVTVPGSWSAGANNGGIVWNFGGSNGAVMIVDDAQRLFIGSTAGSDLISVAGAVSPGDRLVGQVPLVGPVKAWINGDPVHGTALQEATTGTIDSSAWCGADAGGYISRTAGVVVDGQQNIVTDLALFPSWVAHGTLGTLQAPIGTWGDLTYYKGQTIA